MSADMTVAEIERRIAADVAPRDRETAHYEEDKLRADVLRAVAAGATNAAELAAAALKTDDVIDTRWWG